MLGQTSTNHQGDLRDGYARGAAAKIAAYGARLSAGLVFPVVSGLDADDLEFGGQM